MDAVQLQPASGIPIICPTVHQDRHIKGSSSNIKPIYHLIYM